MAIRLRCCSRSGCSDVSPSQAPPSGAYLLAAVIDVSFLLAFAAVACGEIVAGRNWRNLRVLLVLAVLIAGNVVFHAEVIRNGSADYGLRIGISALIGLIMLVGGVPSFTRNWLVRNNPGRLPHRPANVPNRLQWSGNH